MVHSDDDGLVLPPKIAPTQVRIIPIGDSEEIKTLSDLYLSQLKKAGISVDKDDNDQTSPGFKFAEAEVMGIPVRIEIGKRDLENGQITLTRRDTKQKIQVSKDCDITKEVLALMSQIQSDMLARATKRRDEMTYEARTLDEFAKIINTTPGFIKADWCGDAACEAKIKEIRGTKSRCILEGQKPLTGKCVCCGRPANDLVVWGIQY